MSQQTARQTANSSLSFVRKRRVRLWIGVVLLEMYALTAYFIFTSASPTGDLRYLLYPFVWINAGLWAVSRTDVQPGNARHRLLAGTVAIVYFVLLLWIPGQFRLGSIDTGPLLIGADQVRVAWHAPGWGPIVAVEGTIGLYLVPFEVIGYASIAYLVYANVLAAARGLVAGALGLVTCVGCTVPVLVPLLGVLGGGSASLASTATAWSYDAGTAIFLLTVGLLFWSLQRYR